LPKNLMHAAPNFILISLMLFLLVHLGQYINSIKSIICQHKK